MWRKSIRGGLLKLLSRDEIREIHYASLELLHNVGIKVFSDRALQILDEAGAAVDFTEKTGTGFTGRNSWCLSFCTVRIMFYSVGK